MIDAPKIIDKINILLGLIAEEQDIVLIPVSFQGFESMLAFFLDLHSGPSPYS